MRTTTAIATFVLSAIVIGALVPQALAESDLPTLVDTIQQKTIDLAERNERLEQRILVLEERVLELEYMAEKFASTSQGNRDGYKILPHPEPVFNCVTDPCILPEEYEHSYIVKQYLNDDSVIELDSKGAEAQLKRAEALADSKAVMPEEILEKKTIQAEEKSVKPMPEQSKPWWKFW